MLKYAGVGMGVGVVLALLGVSLTDVTELATVAKNRTENLVNDAIPVSVKIDRMEVIRDKLDAQVRDQAMVVAKSKVAAEQSESDLRETSERRNQLVSDLRQLRNRPACAQGGDAMVVSLDVAKALNTKLAAYRNVDSVYEAKAKAVDAQRKAYDRLLQQFVEWQQKRELLGYQIETLRARYATQQLSESADSDVFADADFGRLNEIMEDVELIIRHQEVQRTLLVTPLELVETTGSPSLDEARLLQEVDAVLGVNMAGR